MSFTFYECPSCEFSIVVGTKLRGQFLCYLCAEDNGRDVRMNGRPCKDSDKPEGHDARPTPARSPDAEEG